MLLPVLGYYLTFAHYFGFSIDQPAAVEPASVELAGSLRPPPWPAHLNRKQQDEAVKEGNPNLNLKRRQSLTEAAKRLVKWLAIGFTSFLALNHGVVLADYIYQDSKPIMELMLETRLVATKFSALIFVLSWHFKRAQLRQLIRLVASTSAYIAPLDAPLNSKSSGSNRQPEERRVLAWWLMCVSIIALHFGLSEAEVTSAHHLWQWLDDYSLHTLSNQTTSLATLMLLASADNYIYTVHVYGTRLVGASVICIVCSLQARQLAALRRHALRLTRPAAAASPARVSRTSSFVLGSSSWLESEEAEALEAPVGHLSAPLSRLWRRSGCRVVAVSQERQEKPTPTSDLLQNAWRPRPPAASLAHDWPHLKSRISRWSGGSGELMESANLEAELERLAARYELVRAVNERMAQCFGPMLLVQYSSLFLMSCIDVVYFSVSFNPNTKTKYIIISGMILLWWPYLLLYKFASDIGAQSHELLVSVRRLARLALLERHLVSFRKWRGGKSGGGGIIMSQLDHAFQPWHLSIMGALVVDKFFLLNFAKIVITASVMIIQFIS